MIALSLASTGCSTPSAFGCSDDAQCGAQGVCAAPGYCAFLDPACDSGLAFGAHAGTLAGDCVVPAGESGATEAGDGGAVTSSGTSASPTSATTSPPGTSTLGLDEGSSAGTTAGPEATGATISSTSPSTGAGDTDGSDGGASTGPSPFQLVEPAELALCAYPDNPDPAPAQCEASAGTDAFTVDLAENASGLGQAHGYLAFAIGPEPADATVTALVLRVHTSDAVNAFTDHAGEVWRVESFDEASLAVATPAPIGADPLAADIGAVAVSSVAQWSLPSDILVADAMLYLAIVPLSENGADYLDAASASPPTLEATITP